jgi:hypothetical protein
MAPEEEVTTDTDPGDVTDATQDKVAEQLSELAEDVREVTEELRAEREAAEEQDEQQGFPMPPVEIILHNAVTQVTHVQTPGGVMTLARFITPAFVFTLKVDERGKAGLIRDLLGEPEQGDLLVPKPQIIVPGR